MLVMEIQLQFKPPKVVTAVFKTTAPSCYLAKSAPKASELLTSEMRSGKKIVKYFLCLIQKTRQGGSSVFPCCKKRKKKKKMLFLFLSWQVLPDLKGWPSFPGGCVRICPSYKRNKKAKDDSGAGLKPRSKKYKATKWAWKVQDPAMNAAAIP